MKETPAAAATPPVHHRRRSDDAGRLLAFRTDFRTLAMAWHEAAPGDAKDQAFARLEALLFGEAAAAGVSQFGALK